MDKPQPYATDVGAGSGPGPAEPPRTPRVHDSPPGTPPEAWPRTASLASDPRRKSPALACVLSAMPGLGQIYVGYYQRGFVHILIVGATISFLSAGAVSALEPLAGLFLSFFWLYNVVDAGRRAAGYNLALQGGSPLPLPDDFGMPGLRGSVIGGSVLIGLGVVMLLHTRFGMSLDWLSEWWPVAPILFGAYLVYKALSGRSPAA